MHPDPYQDLAARYDLSFGQFGEQDPHGIEFFRTLFLKNNVHSILDCACGTGRHLRLFQSLGCDVAGSDISAAMLVQAGKNLAECGLDIPLFRADFRDLPRQFAASFDAVACLSAIGFMPGEAECLAAFRSMHDILWDDGLLILTAMPTDHQWKEKPRFQLITNTRDFTRLFVIDYQENTAQYSILDVFHSEARSDFLEWHAELRVFLQKDLERLLRAVGFQRVDFYGSFDFTPYDRAASESLIAVAYKQE